MCAGANTDRIERRTRLPTSATGTSADAREMPTLFARAWVSQNRPAVAVSNATVGSGPARGAVRKLLASSDRELRHHLGSSLQGPLPAVAMAIGAGGPELSDVFPHACVPPTVPALPGFVGRGLDATVCGDARKLLGAQEREIREQLTSSLAGHGPWTVTVRPGCITFRPKRRERALRLAHRPRARLAIRLPRRSQRRERRSRVAASGGRAGGQDGGGGQDGDAGDGEPAHAPHGQLAPASARLGCGSVDGVACEPGPECVPVAEAQVDCMAGPYRRHAADAPACPPRSSSPRATDTKVWLEVGHG
jgi:hypothetical protein